MWQNPLKGLDVAWFVISDRPHFALCDCIVWIPSKRERFFRKCSDADDIWSPSNRLRQSTVAIQHKECHGRYGMIKHSLPLLAPLALCSLCAENSSCCRGSVKELFPPPLSGMSCNDTTCDNDASFFTCHTLGFYSIRRV